MKAHQESVYPARGDERRVRRDTRHDRDGVHAVHCARCHRPVSCDASPTRMHDRTVRHPVRPAPSDDRSTGDVRQYAAMRTRNKGVCTLRRRV